MIAFLYGLRSTKKCAQKVHSGRPRQRKSGEEPGRKFGMSGGAQPSMVVETCSSGARPG
jgi:hypothetical protein